MLLDKKMQVFLTVAGEGSYSKASRKLSLGQSVLSHHIDSLERELGVELFRKKGRNIELTPEGRVLHREGKKLEKAARRTEDVFSGQSRKIARRINLAGDALTCSYTLPWIIASFRADHPDVSFTYRHVHADDISEQVLSGEFDMALAGHAVNNKRLNSEPCFTDEIILVGAVEGSQEMIVPDDLKQLPLLWITSDAGLESTIQKSLQSKKIMLKDLNIFMEVEDLPILKTLVRAGIGYAFLPKITVIEAIKEKRLAEIPIQDISMVRRNYRIYLKSQSMREAADKFLEFVKTSDWGVTDDIYDDTDDIKI